MTFEIRQTETYKQWFASLKDRNARARVDVRIRRMSLGNLCDVKSVGSGVSEIRIDYGPGYRLYFIFQKKRLIILLCGGEKSTQSKDIKLAQEIAQLIKEVK